MVWTSVLNKYRFKKPGNLKDLTSTSLSKLMHCLPKYSFYYWNKWYYPRYGVQGKRSVTVLSNCEQIVGLRRDLLVQQFWKTGCLIVLQYLSEPQVKCIYNILCVPNYRCQYFAFIFPLMWRAASSLLLCFRREMERPRYTIIVSSLLKKWKELSRCSFT